MGKRKSTIYKRWTAWEDDYLRKEYPERSNADLAQWLHRSPRAVQLRALKLGVTKTPEFAAQQFRKGWFRKGQAPFNKGRERRFWASDEAQQRMAKGQFKPGEKRTTSPTYRPIGHEKVYADGYVWIITEHGRRQKHRWVWEQAHGPIPPDHCVKFRDGNRQNCALDNLYLVSRADHARETRAALSPEQKKEIMRKVHDGRRASIRRDKLRLKWGLEPEGKIVKRTK